MSSGLEPEIDVSPTRHVGMTDLLVHVRSAVDRWSASPQRVLAAGALALVAGLAAGALMGSKAWWIAGGLAVLRLDGCLSLSH